MKILSLLLFLIFTFPLQSRVGNIIHYSGDVWLNGIKLSQKENAINLGSEIRTGKNSIAILKLKDQSTLKVNKESSIKVQTILEYKNARSTSIILKAGSLFSKILKSEKRKDKFVLKTKNVAMGVRGTEFFASFGKKEDIWMCVKEGLVAIKNQSKEVLVREGEGVVADSDTRISTPKQLPWTKKLNWNFDPSKEIENKVNIREAYYDLLDQDYD